MSLVLHTQILILQTVIFSKSEESHLVEGGGNLIYHNLKVVIKSYDFQLLGALFTNLLLVSACRGVGVSASHFVLYKTVSACRGVSGTQGL